MIIITNKPTLFKRNRTWRFTHWKYTFIYLFNVYFLPFLFFAAFFFSFDDGKNVLPIISMGFYRFDKCYKFQSMKITPFWTFEKYKLLNTQCVTFSMHSKKVKELLNEKRKTQDNKTCFSYITHFDVAKLNVWCVCSELASLIMIYKFTSAKAYDYHKWKSLQSIHKIPYEIIQCTNGYSCSLFSS